MTKHPSGWSAALIALVLAHCGSSDVEVPPVDAEPADLARPTVTPDGEPPTQETALAPIDPGSDGDLPTIGGQTGDDSGTNGLACDLVTTTRIALDEPSPLGFAPNDIIALALGSRALPLRWLSPVYSPNGALLEYATRASSQVQLSVEFGGKQARLLERTDSTYGVRCEDLLVVDVSVSLTSADGALDEQFEALLYLYPGLASLQAKLPAATLSGSLTFHPPELEGLPPDGLALHVVFTRYGQSGNVTQGYAHGTRSAGFSIADWPDEASCLFDGVTPVLNELTPSVKSVIQTVRDTAGPWTLVNAAGETAPLQIDLAATPETACFSPARFATYGSSATEGDELVVHAELTLASTALPAPIQLPLTVIGQFEAANPAIERAFVSQRFLPCATVGYYSPADFLAHCGDWGIDVSGYTAVSVEVLQSQFGPSGSYAVFSLQGVHYPGCTPGAAGFICPETGVGQLTVETIGEVRIYAQ